MKYILTGFRLTKKQVSWVKKEAKKGKVSEAEIVRRLVETQISK